MLPRVHNAEELPDGREGGGDDDLSEIGELKDSSGIRHGGRHVLGHVSDASKNADPRRVELRDGRIADAGLEEGGVVEGRLLQANRGGHIETVGKD